MYKYSIKLVLENGDETIYETEAINAASAIGYAITEYPNSHIKSIIAKPVRLSSQEYPMEI